MFRGVEWELFEGVKVSYKEEVLSVVTKVASTHKEEVLKLGEGILPHIRTVLARQRRDYRIDEDRFPAQYPVESQAANIDQTPVHNLAGAGAKKDWEPAEAEGAGRSLHLGRRGGHLPV